MMRTPKHSTNAKVFTASKTTTTKNKPQTAQTTRVTILKANQAVTTKINLQAPCLKKIRNMVLTQTMGCCFQAI